jgi:Skp family chaperone for outer membrane proteins
MKKFFLTGFLALSFGLSASADLKIALVDTGKAFDAYYKTKDTAAKIAAKENTFKKEMQDLQIEYEQSQEEAQTLEMAAKDASLPSDVRKDKDSALAQKVQDLQSMERELKQMGQERAQEIRDQLLRDHQEIADEIMKAITDYAGPHGYDLILDRSAVSQRSITLFPFNAGGVVDITDEIIAKLNASAPPSQVP